MVFHFSLKRRTPFCVFLLTAFLSGMGMASSFAAAGSASTPAVGLKLLGVVSSGSAPKAMLFFPDADSEVMVSQGDLVSGYTVLNVNSDVVEVQRGSERFSISMKNGMQPIKAETVIAKAEDKVSGELKLAEVSKKFVSEAKPVTVKKPTLDRVKPADKEAQYAALNSSARPNFIRPMQGGYVSSPFGYRERIAGGAASRYHQGVDIASPHGNPVFAAAGGTVTESGYDGAKGRCITVQHSGGYETRYYHLYKRYAEEGAVVKAGQTIGLEGDSGVSTGPHLHFEIRKNGTALDPALFLSSLRD